MICNQCPRKCNIERLTNQAGYCGAPDLYKIARYSLHMWEEPCISGKNGSGTIFFSGCNLRCIYCQNTEIAHSLRGKNINQTDLVKVMLRLMEMGANNINLVTPSHYIHILPSAIKEAKANGLNIPIIYNTSSYDFSENIKKLEGLIDIYIPDFKYMSSERAQKYSFAADYPEIAKAAIKEMHRQCPSPVINEESGLMEKGIIVRHLVLPLGTRDSKQIVKYIFNEYGNSVYMSVMNQYTPVKNDYIYPELNRKVTKREYNKVVDYILSLNIENCFIQDGDVADASFIPSFSDNIELP